VTDTAAFTFVDFAALDERYAHHLARIPAERWDDTLVPVDEALAGDPRGEPDRVPCIFMVDADNRLQKVLVDEKLLREARRCREAWHSLQELGGIHNSHAQRMLAEERLAHAEQASEPAEANEALVRSDAETGSGPVADSIPEPPAEPSPDEAYIETARCTTCNECTQINDKMFAYDENRQAYIADPDAGTYAQLIEAAESCQVSIIHPGKPRNPNEPDLDELLKRAEPFF
jgi:ferredoxin